MTTSSVKAEPVTYVIGVDSAPEGGGDETFFIAAIGGKVISSHKHGTAGEFARQVLTLARVDDRPIAIQAPGGLPQRISEQTLRRLRSGELAPADLVLGD